ncbi:hypothetical protein BJV74DRAFT_284761 [Russula compacta]|nr:hypothetical protein BJV74DRAFT_284761 [Russula compacta]
MRRKDGRYKVQPLHPPCLLNCFTTAIRSLTNPLRHPFSLSRSRSVYYSFLSTSLMLTVKGSNVGKYVARRRRELWVEDGRVTIKELPDEVLLEVFDSYLVYSGREKWIMLAHMCQRWRYIVFASPIRLNLNFTAKQANL